MFACVQPPPRRPLNFAEAHENDEEKQFRRVFHQLAGDVSYYINIISIFDTDVYPVVVAQIKR